METTEKQKDYTLEQVTRDRRVLELLAQNFGSVSAASTEIINLEAILNLPKGTEHYVADLHGENEAFSHILRNASGDIKRKVTEIFGDTMSHEDIAQLCALIYYPGPKLDLIAQEEKNLDNFYNITLHRLVKVLQSVSSKYTRSKVRKALPKEYAYIIEELLHETPSGESKQMYYARIVETIINCDQAKDFIIALCDVIQRLEIDQLHILGDVYDRGQGAHLIMDTLSHYRDFDMVWGNHDALWMGAACGNEACIANVLRIALRYADTLTLEEGYGINLLPLATFAMDVYADDPCDRFLPKGEPDPSVTEKSRRLMAKMHKAIAVIQFKIEGALIHKHPEWQMHDRLLLSEMDPEFKQVTVGDITYPMLDSNFPTIDPADPYRLTEEEEKLMQKLRRSFLMCDKLMTHIGIFFSHGSLYLVRNSNLMYHASVPLDSDGHLKNVKVMGKDLCGRQLLDAIDMMMREAFNKDTDPEVRDYAVDHYWYLWCGPDSPLFDKGAMTTFERYFIADKKSHNEPKGNYFKMRDREDICDMILDEFGVTGTHRHIINGHVPVKVGQGENPVKANGKLMVIDGGFAKAYHNTTGIAGYTLVYHSRGFVLVQHEPFSSMETVIHEGSDIVSTTQLVELNKNRVRVRDTDIGRELQGQIDELRELLYAYRHGIVKPRR